MAQFEASKAYVPQNQGGSYFDDGREIALLHFVYGHPRLDSFRGSPKNILAAIDEYGRTQNYLMNVGENKGKIVTDLIADVRPETMVELGGYVGYSALLFGDAVRKAGGKRYLSLERNPEFAAIVMSFVDLAGLSDVVKVIVGKSGDSLARLHANGTLERIDLMFLDHFKPAYLADLKLCESLGLVAPGSVLAADNVIKPGNPPYLEYVRSSVQEKRQRFEENHEENIDGSSFAAGYHSRKEKVNQVDVNGHVGNTSEVSSKGNPNLRYETRLVNSFEPTGVPDGVEISNCVAEEGELET